MSIFGVCVGMQVLFESSDEDAASGLGVFPGRVERLIGDVKVPHMGWNTATWTEPREPHPFLDGLADGTRFYFVHSYAPPVSATTVATATHGTTFAAAAAT